MSFSRPTALALASAVACVVAPAPASARVLPVTASASIGGYAIGDAQLEPRASLGPPSAVVSAAGLALGPGQRYAIRSCVQLHVWASPPSATCVTRDVDTRDATAVERHSAPTVVGSATAPLGRHAAWATARVDVSYLTTQGAWKQVASTLPEAGGMPAAIDLRTATLGQSIATPVQGFDLGSGTGGVNSGGLSSMCEAMALPATLAMPAALTAGDLVGAPAYTETGPPTEGDAPRGVALTLHGGGWAVNGTGAAEAERADTDRWRGRGWVTVNATYRACAAAPLDVLWLVQLVRARYPGLPLCIVGGSAGGHLALLAASWLPAEVDCVVAQAAPVALASLASQTAYGGTTPQRQGPRWTANFAAAAFGSENLAAYSPTPASVRARVLLATAEQDTLVPYAQATQFRDALRAARPSADVTAMQLEAGSSPWAHASVSASALSAFTAREDELAAAVIADHAVR